jgi:hypothetical protein
MHTYVSTGTGYREGSSVPPITTPSILSAIAVFSARAEEEEVVEEVEEETGACAGCCVEKLVGWLVG